MPQEREARRQIKIHPSQIKLLFKKSWNFLWRETHYIWKIGFGSTCLNFTTAYSYDRELGPKLLLSYKIRMDLDHGSCQLFKVLCATLLEINTLLLCAISVLLSCGNTELSICSFHNRVSFFSLTPINPAPCPPMSFAVLSKLQVRQALHFILENLLGRSAVGKEVCKQLHHLGAL